MHFDLPAYTVLWAICMPALFLSGHKLQSEWGHVLDGSFGRCVGAHSSQLQVAAGQQGVHATPGRTQPHSHPTHNARLVFPPPLAGLVLDCTELSLFGISRDLT